jgi:hypothetical protein
LSIITDGTLSYTVPIATNAILGGVKPDHSSIIVNSTTNIMGLSGNNILLLAGIDSRSFGWTGSISLLGRVGTGGTNIYSTGTLTNDVVLSCQGNSILQSGTGNSAIRSTTKP